MKLPTVTAICAIGKRGQLGLDGHLPWVDKEDLARFKTLTWGGVLICGFKTYVNMPRLKGRVLYVLKDDETPMDAIYRLNHATDLFLIGGGKTFQAFAEAGLIRHWDITKVDYDGPADVWFDPTWLIM